MIGSLPKGLEGKDPNEVLRVIQKRGHVYAARILQAALSILLIPMPPVGRYLTTVKRGEYGTVSDLRQAVIDSEKRVDDNAEIMLADVAISCQKMEIDFYEVTGGEMGLINFPSGEEIYKRALEFGFEKCSAEDGLSVRKECKDGKDRLIGMDPVSGIFGRLQVFRLYKVCDDVSIGSADGYPANTWHVDLPWVFAWPSSKVQIGY
jgi:hypothetical protein